MNGMGGDLFAIVYEARTGKLYGLNSSGWTPAGAHAGNAGETGHYGSQSAGCESRDVPGAVAGWQALRDKFGTMNFEKLFGAAIYYAENGYPVTELISQEWRGRRRKSAVPGFKETYMPGGHVAEAGRDLQESCTGGVAEVGRAQKGRDGFYKGPMAERLVSFLKEQGNVMTLADLAEFQPEWVDPISTTYHGWRVWELPPNTQGIAALEMLNIMERYPLARIRPQQHQGAARDDRGEKAGVRGYAAIRRRSAVPAENSGGRDDFEGDRRRACEADPAGSRQLRASAGRAYRSHADWQRHDLHVGDRSRRQYRFLDPEQLQCVRHRDWSRRGRVSRCTIAAGCSR